MCGGGLPNEEKTVEFKINKKSLEFVRRDLSLGVEKGEFQVFIGKDSNCLPFDSFKLI